MRRLLVIFLHTTGLLCASPLIARPPRSAAALLRKRPREPLLDPVPVAIKYLENLITLKLSQSKITYMHVAEKERNIWKKLEQ